MSYDITGNLVKIYDTETKGEAFLTREFVIKANDGGKYDNFVKFQMTQDRTKVMDDFSEGDEVKVHFDLRGRKWQEKYFTNLNAWRVEKLSASDLNDSIEKAPLKEPTAEPVAEASDDTGLPF